MEPLFRHLVVGLVPQPTSVPPVPFGRDPLQRVFADVSRDYPYQQLILAPDGSGAQLLNGPEDGVAIQPGLVQTRTPVTMSAEAAREQAARVHAVIADRLRLKVFLTSGVKIIAHVPAPGQDAKVFVSNRLMQGGEHAEVLGSDFFAGGIKYRRVDQTGDEEVLLVEPNVNDNGFLFIDYDVQRRTPFEGIGDLSSWIDEAFEFVRGPTMDVLKGVTDG